MISAPSLTGVGLLLGLSLFLGFAFDSANIRILSLNLASAKTHISTTRYWVPNGDWERSVRAIHPAKFQVVGTDSQDNLAFLRQNVWF